MSGGRPGVLRLLPSPEAAAVTTYEERYGLIEAPFGSSPDVRFAFLSDSFAVALDGTARALRRREGLIVITGAAGAGKSLLCRMLLPRLDPDLSVSMVLDPYLTFEELLLQALCDFGALPGGPLAYAGATRRQLLAILSRFLGSLAVQQASAVILIDEAHELTPAVLQQLRLLSNFETEQAKLLQVVLVGQPDLEERLQQPDLACLGQRVARRYALRPLSPAETSRYIERRLAAAAGMAAIERADAETAVEPAAGTSPVPVRFTPAALRAISARSGGNPRAINLLCDRALEAAHAHAALTIERQYVRAAARALKAPVGRRRATVRLAASAAAAMLFIGVPGGWYVAHSQLRVLHAAADTTRPAVILDGRGAWPQPTPVVAGAGPHAAIGPLGTNPAPAWIGVLRVGGSTSVVAMSMVSAAQAGDLTTRLRVAGLPAFTRNQTGSYDVMVGPYRSRAEAEKAQRDLADRGVVHPRLVAHEASNGAPAPTGPGGSDVSAAAAGSIGAELLILPGRASLVLEMDGEPRQVLVRRVGPRLLEVDAGPIFGRIGPRRLTAPAGVFAIESVSLESVAGLRPDDIVARARLTVPAGTEGNVRVSGRRVYIDLMPAPGPGHRAPPARSGPALQAAAPAGLIEAPTSVAAVAAAPPDATAPEADTYRTAVDGAVRRFEEIQPFLMSAAAEPEDHVLAALANTLRALGAVVRRTDVPAEVRGAHDLLSSAVELAGRAVEPDFSGDRLDQAREAVSQFAAAKSRLQDVL